MDDKAIERAARELCRLRGLAPDESVGHAREGSGAWYFSPRWMLAADEVRAQLQINEAIRMAGGGDV